MSRPSTTPSWNRNSSVAVPTPTPENNYLGFCKNAVRLQNGDRGAFEKNAEHAYSRSGYSSQTIYYLSCRSSKCSYMSQLKADTIWDRVWTDPELGIKWRWAFLAKSHVQQKQVKGQQFSYQWREDLGRQSYRASDESRFLAQRSTNVLWLLGQEHLQHRL